MATKREERINKLEAKRDQINARLQRERARESAEARKADTRRKIIIGAGVESAIKGGLLDSASVYAALDQVITRERDREALGLPVGKVDSDIR